MIQRLGGGIQNFEMPSFKIPGCVYRGLVVAGLWGILLVGSMGCASGSQVEDSGARYADMVRPKPNTVSCVIATLTMDTTGSWVPGSRSYVVARSYDPQGAENGSVAVKIDISGDEFEVGSTSTGSLNSGKPGNRTWHLLGSTDSTVYSNSNGSVVIEIEQQHILDGDLDGDNELGQTLEITCEEREQP